MKISLFFSVFLLCVGGCAGAPASVMPVVAVGEDVGANAGAGAAPGAAPGNEVAPQSKDVLADEEMRVVRTVEQAELRVFLERGPAYALQQVPVQPTFRDGRFAGYQVESFFKDEPEIAARAGIQVGDVIVSVNKKSIAKPENFYIIWQDLKTAERFSIQIMRGDVEQTLEWVVVGEGGAAGL
jgi:S1-C subfamily serine protease